MSSGAEHFAQVPDDLLRLDREARVVRRSAARSSTIALRTRLERRRSSAAWRVSAMPRSAVADVAQHADRDDVVLVHLGRQRVDVDDDLVAVRVPHVGVVLDHVVADADHHVGLLEREPRQVARLQADRAQRQLVGERHHALGHEGVGHRDAQHFGEAHQRVGRALADHAVAGQDDRALRLAR